MRTLFARSYRHWPTVVALALVLAGLYGSSPISLVNLVRAEPSEDDDPAEPGLLILTEDRVVSGRILRNGQNYLVKLPNNSSMFVPASSVVRRCRTLQDAYRQMRVGFPENHGAESHMRLARWCVTQRLFSEAREELKDALRLEPDRAEANDMLQRVDQMLDRTSRPEPKNVAAIVESAKQGIRPDEIESLGGLPRDTANHFTRRIQPLLMRHCATAGCHGPQEESNFKLQRITLGPHSNRHDVERNLANILKFIDVESPRQSPLLIKPKGAHGKGGRSIFVGQRGAQQYRELKDWVLTVASSREEAATIAARKSSGRRPTGKIQPTSHKADAASEKSVEPAIASTESNPFPDRPLRRKGKPNSPETDATGDSAAEKADSAAADPFDPAEFNRLIRK